MSEFDFESIKNKAIEQLRAGKPLLGLLIDLAIDFSQLENKILLYKKLQTSLNSRIVIIIESK